MALRLLLALSLLHSVWVLWPIPAALSTGNTTLVLSSKFYFDITVQNAPADLHNAVQQVQYYLENDKLSRLVVGRGANDSAALTNAKSLPSLKLTLFSGTTANPIATESVKPLGMRSEEYVLTIPADGSPTTLSANSTLGLYRGLTMFGQMWYYVAHFAYVVGSAEIDTPGQTTIIGTTYPEYVACMNASPWSTYAKEPPAGQLRFALPGVVNFTTSLLSSVTKTLPSYYFSTGGGLE